MRDYRLPLAVGIPTAIAVVVVLWMLRKKPGKKDGGDKSRKEVDDVRAGRREAEEAEKIRGLGMERDGITITQRKIPESQARDRGAADLGNQAAPDVNGGVKQRTPPKDIIVKGGSSGRKKSLSDVQLDQVEKLVVSAMGDGLHEAKGKLVSLGNKSDDFDDEYDSDEEVTVTEYFDLSKSASLDMLSPDKVITCSSKAKVGFNVGNEGGVCSDEGEGSQVQAEFINQEEAVSAPKTSNSPMAVKAPYTFGVGNVSESAAEADTQNSPTQQAAYFLSLDPSVSPFSDTNVPSSTPSKHTDTHSVSVGNVIHSSAAMQPGSPTKQPLSQEQPATAEQNEGVLSRQSSSLSKRRLESQGSLGPEDIDSLWGINPASRASTNWDKQLSLDNPDNSSPTPEARSSDTSLPSSSKTLRAVSEEKSSSPSGQDLSKPQLDTARLLPLDADSSSKDTVEAPLKPNSPVCDSNSEGSNDSGRGGSEHDATPVGSCGTESLVQFDFNMPSDLCGRFIGRHGRNINFVKTKTGARISLENNPFTAEYQICQVIGTQGEVDSALAMIRRKFPLQDYPMLTMVPISIGPVAGPGADQSPVVVPDIMQLSLPEGASVEVYVSAIVDAGHVFVQQPTHRSFMSLDKLNYDLNTCYGQDPNVPAVPTPVECGVICVVENEGHWYRAMIMTQEDENGEAQIKFVDYGGYASMPVSLLKQIRTDFMALPFQAVECFMANITPNQGCEYFTEESSLALSEMTSYQLLQCQVVARSETGVPYIHLYQIAPGMNTAVLINRALVNSQHARWVEIL